MFRKFVCNGGAESDNEGAAIQSVRTADTEEVASMASVVNKKKDLQSANYSGEEFEAKVKKGGSGNAVIIFFGTQATKPQSGEYDYLPVWRQGQQCRVLMGLNGELSPHMNLYTGMSRIVDGKVEDAAKECVADFFDAITVTGEVECLKTEHRGTVTVIDGDNTKITYYIYYAIFNHLRPESDLWFMMEGFRCYKGFWKKWVGQEMHETTQAELGQIRVLTDFGMDDLPYHRMPAHYRSWLPCVIEGNCFVTGSFNMRGNTLMKSDMNVKFVKPLTHKSIWSTLEGGNQKYGKYADTDEIFIG